jgi:hypothetical protein
LVISTPTDALGAELPPAAVSLPLQAKVEERRTGLTQRVGLGAIARVHPAELADVGINFFQRIGLCTSCGWTVERSRPSEHTRTAVKHLREAVRPPGLVIFGVLIGFALLAGPGSYVYLVLNRRRPLAYVGFVVSAALGSSALILGADLLRNGVSARVIPRSLVFVDQRVDAELGVEEIAVHVPIGFGIAVHERAGMQIMLPTQISDRSQATLHALVEPRGLLLRGAVAVRDRRMLGARWIARAQGRLSVHVEPRGLGVENHLGRDLSELRVWHAGVEHELRSLPNGARGLATPASRSLDDDRSAFLSEPFTSAARDLLQRVARGRVNERRFVANFVWNPASSGVLDDSVGAYQPGAHVIAGVY